MAIQYHFKVHTQTVIINTDNQTSTQAIADFRKQSGQVYVMQAVQLINQLRNLGISTQLH